MAELLAARLIRDVPDFPQPGVLFRDITPVLADAAAFQEIIDRFVEWISVRSPDAIVGIESRGFLLGAPAALALGLPFVPIRKVGKLPHTTIQEEYALEYASSIVEIHRDSLAPNQRAVIIDDLLATGGTARASAKLVEQLNAKVAGFCFMIELESLGGRELLAEYDMQALLKYD